MMLFLVLGAGSAVAQAPPQVFDAVVGPWKLEAEDYLWYTNAGLWDEPQASGGRTAKRPGYGYMLLDDLPFPRTGRPVTIYMRVRPDIVAETYKLLTT
jgi:hypothetical protein